MSGLLKNLLSHLTPRFQPSSPTKLCTPEVAPPVSSEVLRLEDPNSAGELLIECLRGYAQHRRLPDAPHFRGDMRSEADLRFAMTMAASKLV